MDIYTHTCLSEEVKPSSNTWPRRESEFGGFTCVYVYIYICIHRYVCIYIYTLYIHICTYVCIYIERERDLCKHTCICIYIYIYIHTHTLVGGCDAEQEHPASARNHRVAFSEYYIYIYI